MAEWLRRLTANQLGSARESSNLFLVEFLFFVDSVAILWNSCIYRYIENQIKSSLKNFHFSLEIN